MKHLLTACSLAALFVPGIAQAATVYQGCAVPSLKPVHRTFYVDPAKGSKSGDGSAAKPWRTLAEVLDRGTGYVATQGHNERTWYKGDWSMVAVNPNGVIKPGDVIMLMSGDHGSFFLQNFFNPDFITVMAAPGQTPVIDRLTIVSSAKWMFQGVKFQSIAPPGTTGANGLVNVGGGDWLGTTNNIIFDNNSFSSTDDTSAWTDADWMSKPFNYALFSAQTINCVSITNNHFYNVLNGIQLASSESVAQGNLIEKMSNDGMDILASNLIVKGNTIKNGVNSAKTSPLHADGIQGWSQSKNGQDVVNKNVLIDSNTIVKTGDSSLSYLQGISIFDGKWDGLTISNNVVVSNSNQGIALYGGANSTIVNNTVIASSTATVAGIVVAKGGGAVPASNVTVRNNITPSLQILTPGVTVDHNIAAGRLALIGSNGIVSYMASGASGTNKIVPAIMSEFVTLNNANQTYDLRPKSNSVALNFGDAVQAPVVDIVGKARKPTVTVGAYN